MLEIATAKFLIGASHNHGQNATTPNASATTYRHVATTTRSNARSLRVDRTNMKNRVSGIKTIPVILPSIATAVPKAASAALETVGRRANAIDRFMAMAKKAIKTISFGL